MLEWLKLRLRRALPKRSSNPQAPVRLHKETSHLEPCRSTAQCYHRDPLHRKTTLPIQTTLAQILSVYSFPSQAKNILGKCLFFFLFKLPKKQEKTDWTYVADDLGQEEISQRPSYSLMSESLPGSPSHSHQCCGFFSFCSRNLLYEVLTVLTALCVIQSFPAQARKKVKMEIEYYFMTH